MNEKEIIEYLLRYSHENQYNNNQIWIALVGAPGSGK